MKKQLIILSALIVTGITQCSLYDRMKAKASSAAQSVKQSATSAYDKLGGMAQSAQGKAQAEQFLYGAMQKKQQSMTQEIVQAFQLQQTMLQMDRQYNKPAAGQEGNPTIKTNDSIK